MRWKRRRRYAATVPPSECFFASATASSLRKNSLRFLAAAVHFVVNLLPFVATRYGPASRALPLLYLSAPRLTLRGAGLLVFGGVASGPQGSLMVRSDCLGYERELKPVPQTEIRTVCGLPQPVRLRKSLSLKVYTHTLGNTIYPQ